MKATVIILEVEEYKHNKLSRFFVGETRETYLKLKEKIDKLNNTFQNLFYLPIDIVGFSVEVAIHNKNYVLAKFIAEELYKCIVDSKPEATVKIGIGYGEITYLGKRLHHSNGPILIKVGRSIDNRKHGGIEIFED